MSIEATSVPPLLVPEAFDQPREQAKPASFSELHSKIGELLAEATQNDVVFGRSHGEAVDLDLKVSRARQNGIQLHVATTANIDTVKAVHAEQETELSTILDSEAAALAQRQAEELAELQRRHATESHAMEEDHGMQRSRMNQVHRTLEEDLLTEANQLVGTLLSTQKTTRELTADNQKYLEDAKVMNSTVMHGLNKLYAEVSVIEQDIAGLRTEEAQSQEQVAALFKKTQDLRQMKRKLELAQTQAIDQQIKLFGHEVDPEALRAQEMENHREDIENATEEHAQSDSALTRAENHLDEVQALIAQKETSLGRYNDKYSEFANTLLEEAEFLETISGKSEEAKQLYGSILDTYERLQTLRAQIPYAEAATETTPKAEPETINEGAVEVPVQRVSLALEHERHGSRLIEAEVGRDAQVLQLVGRLTQDIH